MGDYDTIQVMKNLTQGSLLWRIARFLVPLQVILVVGSLTFIIGVTGTFTALLLRANFGQAVYVVTAPGAQPPPPQRAVPTYGSAISPIFTPEVQHWNSKIIAWSRQYDIDPNMLATVMQIESCGDWQAGSVAGAQGLFQVMPFHFKDGEDSKDPDTNARAGIVYLKQSLAYADGHFGLALAGYNGGHGVISLGWARWAGETQRYYIWGSGIYMDTVQGKTQSDTLQNWLDAGGTILCGQAASRIANTPPPAPVGGNLAAANS